MRKIHLFILSVIFSLSAFAQMGEADKQLALNLVKSHLKEIGLTEEDAKNSVVSSTYQSLSDGIRMVYLQQSYQGIPVFNQMHVLAFRNNQLLSVAGNRVANISQLNGADQSRPAIMAPDAVRTALQEAKVELMNVPAGMPTADGKLNFGKMGVTQYDVKAEQVWLPVSTKEIRLTWQVEVAPVKSHDHWLIRVDAMTNRVLDKNNYTVFEHFMPEGTKEDHAGHQHDSPFVAETNSVVNNQVESPAVVSSANYRVIPFPAESPIHAGGTQASVSNPWTLAGGNATSLGWHFDGTTYHDSTRGNNVWAQEDRDNSNSTFGKAGTSSTAQPGLTFDNAYDFAQAPTINANQQMAITNLFYWNNLIHDITYLYGFDEPSGNFQASNQGRGGAGNDYVIADAQDAGGTNNANFATPTDGSRPRMQMYLWTGVTPNRDGDLDNGIVVHEYGHGISNRLTGGPANSSCLGNAEQGGEGWSDFFTLMYTTNWATAQLTDGAIGRGIGTYALNQAVTGAGIRRYKYSTNMTTNPWTYAMMATNTNGAVHTIGEIWCTALWEMTWEMIAQDGINPNIFNPSGTGGNTAALKLVVEGLRLQPCSPGFIDARNAILKADSIFFNKRYNCAIWRAFAKRGMGTLASQGLSTSYTDQVASFVSPGTANLQLLQSVTSQQEGLLVTYTNRVSSGDCSGLSNYILTDTLPANVNYVSGGTYNAGNRVVSFPVNLSVGQTQDYSFVVQIAPGSYFTPDTLINEKLTGTAGTIPAGWSASSTTSTVWTTHNTRSFSASNSFFSPNSALTSDLSLATTGSYAIGSNIPEFSFWHWYNSESAYDGGVIEISTNGGTTWSDLGSAITQNGYNGALASGSALGGRSAFTGNSGAFINTKLNLSAYANQNVRFRFRFASDASVSVTGWNIDDVLMFRLAKVNIKSNLFNNNGVLIFASSVQTLINPPECSGQDIIAVTGQPQNQAVCAGANVTFTVTTSGLNPEYQWQVSSNGGSSYTDLAGQTSATLSLLSVSPAQNNLRYRCIADNACTNPASISNEAILTVYSLPLAPAGSGSSICGSGSLTISATPGAGEITDWYAAATGGLAIQTASNTYNTAVISTTTTYYAQSRNIATGCLSATRTPVTAQVNSRPLPPSPSGGIAACGSGAINLTAVPGQNQTVDWYAGPSGGLALQTGSSSFTTPVLNSTTIYYAESRDLSTGCISASRAALTATVNSLPAAPSGQNGSRCGTGAVVISATPGVGETIDWYVIPTGGLAVVTGSSTYNTGTISNNTVYYAESRNTTTGCKSASRTAVTATINKTSASTTSVTICGSSLPYNWNGQSFGSGGVYEVTLSNSLGCDSIATLLLDIAPAIQAYNVTGGGSYVNGGAGLPVGLITSQIGVSYQLVLNGSTNVGLPVTGNGSAISFGNQTAAGVYTVFATTPYCTGFMNNSVTITVTQPTTPLAFAVTGGGTYCQGTSGIEVGLAGSETGVSYQLQRSNGTINVGSAVNGTGSALSFGLQTVASDYSVLATNITSQLTQPMLNYVLVRISQVRAPSSPGAISGPTDACPFIGGAPVVYRVNQASNATSYLWTAPAGASIVGSNSDTVVSILYPPSFVTGTLSVASVNSCFNNAMSAARAITIRKNVPSTPGAITASLVNPCAITGTNTTSTYTIRKVSFATGYNWVLSSGITLVSSLGDTGIVVRFNAGYTTGTISVQALNNCATSAARVLTVTATRPGTPGTITGTTNVCSLVGQPQTTTYTIIPVSGALSYNWTVPANASIISGQGTTQLEVSFLSGYVTGSISVASVSNCGSSALRSLSVVATKPGTPSAISGPAQVCSFVGQPQTAVYSISPVAAASSYSWTVPANTTIVSGQGTTSIELSFAGAFSYGTLSVRSVATCGTSSARTLALTKLVTKPGAISASGLPCPDATVTYSIAPVANATSYQWSLPSNAIYVSGQGTTSYTVTFRPAFTTGTVTVKSLNACSSSAVVSMLLDASTCAPARYADALMPGKIEHMDGIQLSNAYPNPNNGQFYVMITAPSSTENVQLQLFDMFGRQVWQKGAQLIKGNQQRINIQAGQVSAGVYELRCTSKGKITSTRVVISR